MGSVDCLNGRCVVEAGPFWMGSDFSAAECPIHEVVLSPFEIDQYEVTLEDWQRCVNQGRCTALPEHCTGPLYNRPDFSNQFPAICVTWQQRVGIVRALGGVFQQKQSGRRPQQVQKEPNGHGDHWHQIVTMPIFDWQVFIAHQELDRWAGMQILSRRLVCMMSMEMSLSGPLIGMIQHFMRILLN